MVCKCLLLAPWLCVWMQRCTTPRDPLDIQSFKRCLLCPVSHALSEYTHQREVVEFVLRLQWESRVPGQTHSRTFCRQLGILYACTRPHNIKHIDQHQPYTKSQHHIHTNHQNCKRNYVLNYCTWIGEIADAHKYRWGNPWGIRA